jgi:hypothetical protein
MTTERVRTTISLTPDALAVFKRMADAGNMSVSRCMGDWLVDTADAAEMLTLKMEEAKRAPLKVMREMRAMVAGMGLGLDEMEVEVRERRQQAERSRAATEPKPPSGNTGVLVPPTPMTKSNSASTSQRKKV